MVGTDRIDRIEILKDLQVAFVHPGSSDGETFTWRDEAPLDAGVLYYLRVWQADNERAWTSPIWVDPAQ